MPQEYFVSYIAERKTGKLVPCSFITSDPKTVQLIKSADVIHGLRALEEDIRKRNQTRFTKRVTVMAMHPWPVK